MPTITILENYQIVSPESAEHGDYYDQGDIGIYEIEFRDLVELLECCEYSGNGWATNYEYDIDYESSNTESRSYHPADNRDLRYFIKACKLAGIYH